MLVPQHTELLRQVLHVSRVNVELELLSSSIVLASLAAPALVGSRGPHEVVAACLLESIRMAIDISIDGALDRAKAEWSARSLRPVENKVERLVELHPGDRLDQAVARHGVVSVEHVRAAIFRRRRQVVTGDEVALLKRRIKSREVILIVEELRSNIHCHLAVVQRLVIVGDL